AAYRDQPAPVPRETFYGFRDRDKEYLNQDSFTVRFEHDFSDNFTFRNQLRYGRAGRNSIVSPPPFASNDHSVINRCLTSWVAHDRVWYKKTDVRSTFNTGFIQHTANLGAAFLSENNVRFTRSGITSQTTLFNPNPDAPYTGPITVGPN